MEFVCGNCKSKGIVKDKKFYCEKCGFVFDTSCAEVFFEEKYDERIKKIEFSNPYSIKVYFS